MDDILDDLDLLESAPDQSLASKLLDSFVPSNFHDPDRYFLPGTYFKNLITEENIEIELGKIGPRSSKLRQKYTKQVRQELAIWIRREAPKTFAIAIQCGLGPDELLLSMRLFQSTGFNDENLPLPNPRHVPRKAFDSRVWSDLKLRDFYDKQWRCLVPVFIRDRYDYDLSYNCILPFTKEDVVPKVGAFSSVYKVRIHPDHQRDYQMNHVAIKEIQVTRGNDMLSTDKAWEQEASALANMNKIKHPQIVECIAAIRRGDSRYFMFPWADGGSLRDFWAKTAKQNPSAELIRQTIEQLRGLADALHCLHNFHDLSAEFDTLEADSDNKHLGIPKVQDFEEDGDKMDKIHARSIRHGDLKPENILRFMEKSAGLGTLKIADMGLAKQHIVATQDKIHLTSTIYGTVQYEAPEATVAPTGLRSCLSDVWSMGCITLEFVIWLLYGNNELVNFYSQIKGDGQQGCRFFEVSKNGDPNRAQVHKVVLEWIAATQDTDPECSDGTALGDLLKFVRENLLVAALPPNRHNFLSSGRKLVPPTLGDRVTRYRATAKQFRDALDEILSKTGLPGYLYTGTKRAHIKLPNRMDKAVTSSGNWLSGILERPIKTPDRDESSKKYVVVFQLDWDPLAFVKEQEYSEAPEEVLEKVITLTGTLDDAQALTTKAYLCQTWPVTGEQVMGLVNDSLRSKIARVNYVFPGGTELAVQFMKAKNSGHKFLVTATGTADSIAEIGQQFAWLGAALRSSPFESGIALCSPTIQDIRREYIPNSPDVIKYVCRIEFLISAPEGDTTLPGQCWHNMFRNPVMVRGYPILPKQEPGVGIEMPLNMMAGLIDTDRAIEFNSNVFIKGFSSMLVAVRIAGDLLIWHHFYNCTGDMMSFDRIQQVPDKIDMSRLDSFRHVVGWCSQCVSYAGANDADYNVQGSELPPTTAGCVLEKASISGGKLLTAGLGFALGVKDIPHYRPPNGYIMTLRNMEKKYVVLWDDDSKRGWLVNGTSALLHLVRAWLLFAATDNFSSRFLYDPAKLIDGINHHKPDSATEVLINASNMALPIYPGSNELSEEEETKWKTGGGSDDSAEQNREPNTEAEESLILKRKKGYFLFENLVQHYLSIMHQIFEHQQDKAGRNGIKIKQHVRTYLEGWDFLDLATDCDPHPRVASLNAMGYGWVDFIRSIGAITLLGCSFGDIIRPIAFSWMCPEWTSLPPDNYYLAVSAMDLKNITGTFGTTRTIPTQPVHGLVWHCPTGIMASCKGQCRVRGLSRRIHKIWKPHSDPVQVFYPKRMQKFLQPGRPEKLHSEGAVVFGHNFSWKYRWRADAADDIEECDDAASTAHPLVYDPGTEPSTEANGSSAAGQSSAQACGSSLLPSPTSILVDSNAPSPRPPPSVDTGLVNSTIDLPFRSEQQLLPQTRRLRREKRRFGPR